MMQKKMKMGLSIEARDVALLVQTASKFASNIKIEVNNKIVNAKSIMGIIALGALDGVDVTIMAEGKDEEDAIK
ncbi:MAG: HPr family phosphocarrier protein [Eubacteriales bacterium]|nr:HPr family phosphocarrier protein [Eubacteriales bacterium]